MSLDDLVLRLQRWLDRLVRRLYRGRAPEATRRRVLIVQIDGLSRSVLTQALTDGTAPFLARLVRHQGWRLTPMSVGLPTSTPAFQMSAMYGVRPDIPGFHYLDPQGVLPAREVHVGVAALVVVVEIGRASCRERG